MLEAKIYKNGAWQTQFISVNDADTYNYSSSVGTAMLDLDASDYIELYVKHNAGNSKSIFGHSQIWSCWLAGYRVSED